MSKDNLDKNGDGGGNTVQCPICGAENAAGAEECTECSFTFETEPKSESIVCNECGAELPAGTESCFICGAVPGQTKGPELQDAEEMPETPAPAEPSVPEESQACPACGAELSAEAESCFICGAELIASEPPALVEEPVKTDDSWDLGVVGGEPLPEEEMPEVAPPAAEPEASEPSAEPAKFGENEFQCPACGKPIQIGTSKCQECWAEIPEMFRCPRCQIVIPIDSTACPDCFAKLKDGVLFEEETEPAPEEPLLAEEPIEELMLDEEMEEITEEETTEIFESPDVFGIECPFCHSIANPSEDICPECGMPLIEEDEKKEERPSLDRKKDDTDWYRMIAIGVVLLLLVSGILPFAVPLPHIDRAQIRIDGAFGDWDRVAGQNDTSIPELPANVDIVNYKMLSDAFNAYFFMGVRGTAFGDLAGETARVFIDIDQDSTTGYDIMGIGADYQIRVFGHNGVVESSSCLRFDANRPQNDFNAFETSSPSVPHTAQSLQDANKFEVRVALEDIDMTSTQPVTAVFYMADSIGHRDYSDTPLTNIGSILFVKQSSFVPADGIITGNSAQVLGLEIRALGRQVTIDDIAVQDCAVPQYERTMAPDTVQLINLTTNAVTPAASAFIHREALPTSFVLQDTHVIVVGQGAYAYARSAPVTISIDGAFADWTGRGMTLDDAPDDQMSKNGIHSIDDAGLDMLSQTTQLENNRLNVLVETAGDIFAGMWVPELEEAYVDTATDGTRSEATQPQSDYTYTEPPVSNTRQTTTAIQRPTDKPEKTGEGKVRVFIDSGSSAPGYRINGITADYLIEVMGQKGEVTRTVMHRFTGTDPNMETWTEMTSSARGASSGSRVELGIPLASFINVTNNATAVIQLVDWNLNGDVADITAWDVFQSGDRYGTRDSNLAPTWIFGSVRDFSNELLRGATVVGREASSGQIASFITYTDPWATGSSYVFHFEGSANQLIYLYATNGTQYGTTSVTYPINMLDPSTQAPTINAVSTSSYAPKDFTIKNLAPLGSKSIELSWTADTNPNLFRVFRTTNTKSEGNYDESGRHYGSYIYTINTPASRSYLDSTPVLNQTNWYILRSEGAAFQYSVEIGIMADFYPPVITHENVTEWYGSFRSIKANITDAVGVQNATVYYRIVGTSTYSQRTMSRISGTAQAGDWEAIIPLEFDQGMIQYEYYIMANDGTFDITYGGPGNPIVFNSGPAPNEPYPIYGYVYWNSTPPTPVPGADVFVSWENTTGAVINEPGAFPYVTNSIGQYSVDLLNYDSNSDVWANASITISGTDYLGFNSTQVVITNGSGEGERVDIYLEAPLLNITKTAPARAIAGQNIIYTITVENIGNTTAHNVIINETYPSEVIFVSSSPIDPDNLGSGNDTWTIPDIVPGGTYVLNITVQVRPSTLSGTDIMNRADVNWTLSNGAFSGSDYDTATTRIGAAILNITKWAPATANPGQFITYWLNYSNIGTEWAFNVNITETYPAGVSFSSSTPAPTFGNNVWIIPQLAPYIGSGKIQITVLVAPTATGTITNVATITAPGLVVNTTQASTLIINPRMTVTKSAPLTANAGQTITYQINYWNNGTDTAYDVVITEDYPADVIPVSQWSNPPVTCVWPGTWYVGDLAPGASGTIYVNVTIDSDYSGTLMNQVTLNYENSAIAMPPVHAWANTTVANPLITVQKTAPATANTGQQIIYRLLVRNIGTANAVNVVITENYPSGVSYVSAIPAPDVGFTNRWTIPILAPGASYWINITVQVSDTASGTITNTANAIYEDAAGQDLGPVTASASFTVADPLITINKDGPASANSGQTITYWVNFTNIGTAPAYNIIITETYPTDVTFISATPAPTIPNNTWFIPFLAAGASGSIRITVQIDSAASDPQVNTAILNYEDAAGESQAQVSDSVTTILNNPQLFVTKTAPEFANPGQDITYTVTIQNTGSEAAYNVVLTEYYPAGVTFVNAVPIMPNNPPLYTIWDLGSIPVGGSIVILITVHIGDTTTGSLLNTVTVDYETDSGLTMPQETANASTMVSWPVMTINKSGPLNATAGQTIMYTITYENTGTDTAMGVVITETYPADVTFLNANPMPTTGNNVWVIGNVNAGTSRTIFINVTIGSTATGILVNSVTLRYNNTAGQIMSPVSDTWNTFLSGPWMNIEKSGPVTANTGQNITYTLHYWNNGTDVAHDINITETYPAGTTFVSATPAPTYGNNIWFISTLAAGAHRWINITVRINDGVYGNIANRAYLNYENSAGVTQPQASANWTTTILDPLMTMTKTGPATANPDGTITYVIYYQNIGNAVATNVVITETYSTGVSFVNATPAPTGAGNNTWNIGTLNPGQSGMIFINVTITATSGTIWNTATLTYQDAAGEVQDPIVRTISTVLINPYLTIEKTGPNTAAPGQQITYTITVTNIGSDWAYNVIVVDLYPLGVTFIGAIPAPFFNNNTWMVPLPLAPFVGSFTIQVTLQINDTTTGTIWNTVAAICDNEAGISQPIVTDMVSTTIIDCIVTIDKTAPQFANTGEFITYTLTYENTGDDWAYNVVITETYDSNVTFFNAIPAPSNGNNIWFIGDIAPGDTGSIEITVQVKTGLPIDTELINNATVTYENFGGLIGAGYDEVTTTVIDPLLDISKTGTASAQPGGTATYQITYQNLGNDTAYNVVITDTLPVGMVYHSSSPSGSVSGQVITWNIGTLAPGASVIITLNVTISPTASGTLTNNVQIVGYNNANVQFTDMASATTDIIGPYVQIVKTGPTYAAPGTQIVYTITYRNTGPGIAYNVWVNDTLPIGSVTFVSATPGYLNNTPIYSWFLGNLASNAGGTITITVLVNPTATTLINNATTQYYTNNLLTNQITHYSNLTTIVNSPLLTVTKTAPATVVTGQLIQYVITITNIGNNDAQSVVLIESYPAGTTFVSAFPWAPIAPANTTWNIVGSIPAGGTWSVTVTVRVTATSGILMNSVRVNYDNQGGIPQTPVWAYANTTVVNPLLTVDKTAPATANTGETITYTITVTNTGTARAYDIWVNETYPDVTYVTSTPLPSNYGGANNSWYISSIAVGGTYTISITVIVNAPGGSILNRVDVAYENFANLVMIPIFDTAQTNVINPDMAVTKWAQTIANPGEEITYWITYTNNGDDWAYNVVITETYPTGVSFVSSIPNPDTGFNNVWTIGMVAPGGSGSIEIKVLVSLGTNGWALNNMVSLDYDNNAGIPQPTESASDSTDVVQPNMVITKTVASATATQGQTIIYTIYYENTGDDMAYNVIIADAVPSGVSFVNSTPNPTVPGVWVIGDLNPGESGYIYITVTVGVATTGIVTNWAYLDYENYIGTEFSAQASVQISILAPQMTISKTAPVTANTGQTITYTITYQNVGTAPASNIVIRDTLPAGVNYVSSSPSGTFANPIVTWNIVGTLAPGASGTITVTVTVTAASGTLTNTASVDYRNSAGLAYPTEWAYAYTDIINPAMTIEKTAPATANTGQDIQYVIWVNNTGDDTAFNVIATETYPAGVTFKSAIPSPTSGNNVWNLGNLGPGSAVPIFVTVTINASASGLLVNTVLVGYRNSVNIVQQPVSDTASTLVGDPMMDVAKSAPQTANAGQTIMYTIRYWNNGTSAAYNVVITETYPGSVTFVNANPAPTTSNNIWVIPMVPAGGSGVIYINVTINTGTIGFITNVVGLDYEDAALQPRPTETAQAVTVLTGPYITLSKTGPEYANPGQVIMYTITYRNIGTDTAMNLWINETFPTGVTFLNSNPARTSDYNWFIGNLAAGASGRIYINVTVSNTATGTLQNTVNAAYTDSVGTRYSIQAVWDTIVREPIMEVAKSGPAVANPGATITYWITYTNVGSDWAYNVTITETYPADVTYVSAIPAPTTGSTIWVIGSVAPGASGSIQITVNISASIEVSSITNSVRLTYRNSAGRAMVPVTATFVTLIVNPQITLEKIAITTVSGGVFPGEVFTYMITYRNTGGDWAYDVRITEIYPTGVSFYDSDPDPDSGTTLWIIGDLAPGASGTIEITVILSDTIAPLTILTNTVTANYENTVGSMPPVTTIHTMPVIAPNLVVTKTAPAEANTGQQITYRVTITNVGNAMATGIILVETYDIGVSFIRAVPSPDVSSDEWYVWDLLPGMSWSVDITVQVKLDAFGTLENLVTVDYIDQIGHEYSAEAEAATLVVDPAISIMKEGPFTVNTGQTISYWLNITNFGTDDAYNVVVTEYYPADVSYVNAAPLPTSGNNIWLIPVIAHGTTYTIRIDVLVSTSASGVLHNYVTVDYSNSVRPFPQVERFLNTLIIDPEMELSKEAPVTANPGQSFAYWLNYSNTGTDWAYDVIITETYPAGVNFQSATPAPTFGNNVWVIGDVAPGASGAIQIFVQVRTDAQDLQENTATLAYNNTVRVMQPVTATAETMIIYPLLTITKTAPATATQGEEFEYVITVTNIGTDGAYDVWVYETYPGTIFLSSEPSPAIPNNAWNFSYIPPGSSVTITIRVRVPMSAYGNLENVASVDYFDSIGQSQGTEWAYATTAVIGPLLTVDKWATPHANAMDLITYWINITNTGTGWAYDIMVTETYPIGVTFISSIPSPYFGNGTWNIATLAPGATVNIQITVQVKSGQTGILTNRVDVDYENVIGISYPTVWDLAVTTLGDTPNVLIQKSAPQYANPGDIIMYTITYQNIGNTPVNNVWINDTLPFGTTYYNSTSYDYNAGPIYGWDIGPLNPGQGGTIFINVNVTGQRFGVITNYAMIEYQNSTFSLFSNYATANTVVRDVLMNITKTGPFTASVGQTFSYTITYSNVGNETAYDISIHDILPTDVSHQFSSPIPSGISGQNLYWNVTSLAPGQSRTITVTVLVLLGAADTIQTNMVTLDYENTVGVVKPTESAEWNTMIDIQTGFLVIDKSAPAEAVPGELITYTINYQNIGNNATNNVVITDTIPSDVDYISASPVPSIFVPTYTWNIPSIAPGGSGIITVTVRVNATDAIPGDTLMNMADITAPGLNTDWAFANTTVVNPLMSITKTVDMAMAKNGETLNYTITYINIGNASAYNVTIIDTMPLNTIYNGVSTPLPDVVTATTLTWLFPILPAGSSGVIYLELDIDVPYGTLVNNATLNYNNTADIVQPTIYAEVTTIVTDVVLQVEKIAPETWNPGTQMTYFINIINLGPNATGEVTLTENYPDGVTYVWSSIAPSLPSNDTWYLGPLSAFGTITVQIIVYIDPMAPDILLNQATVNYTDTGSPPTMQYLNATATTVLRGPMMSVTKTSSEQFVSPGQEFIYTINYVNNGPGPALNVTIQEFYPAGITFIDANPYPNEGNNIWHLGTVGGLFNPPNSGQITIRVRVDAMAGGMLTNRVTLNYQNITGGWQPEQTAYSTTTVPPGITLMYLDKNGPSRATTNEIVQYTLYYQNIGTGTAINVILEDTFLPASFAYLGSSRAESYIFPGRIGWNLGNLVPGARGTITVSLRVLSLGPSVRNNAYLNFTDTLGIRDGEYDYKTTGVNNPLMNITKTAPATANSNQVIQYVINYRNTDTVAFAQNVTITDTLSLDTSYYSAIPVPDVLAYPTYTWFIGTVAPGGSGSITIRVRILSSVANGTTVINNAALSYNNTAYYTRPVQTAQASTLVLNPDVTIQKSGPVTANSGETITYTISVMIIGGDTAHDVVITEHYPGGMVFVSSSPSPSLGDNTWLISSLPVGVAFPISITMRIRTNVPSGTQLNNTVDVTYENGAGLGYGPETAYAVTDVLNPMLTITKTGPVVANTNQTITYMIEVENIGDAMAHDILITDLYPSNQTSQWVTFVNSNLAPVSGTDNQWLIPPLANGTTYTLWINVTVMVPYDLNNTVTATYTDANSGMHYEPVENYWLTMVQNPYVIITKTANLTAVADGYILYNITAENIGNGNATYITVTETYPAGVTFVSASEVPSSGNNVWTFTEIPAGVMGHLLVLVRVDNTTLPGSILSNRVNMTYRNIANTTMPAIFAIANTTVIGPDIAILKTAPSYVEIGEIFNYTIRYWNNGTDWAYNVVIRDSYPLGLTFQGIMAPVQTSSLVGYYEWTIPTIAPGTSGSIQITVSANRAGLLVNNATLRYENEAGLLYPTLYSVVQTQVSLIPGILPPTVTSIPPPFVWAGEEFNLYADAMSFDADIDTIILYFIDIFGNNWNSIMVPLLVTSNGSGMYRLLLPAQPYKGFVSYFVWVNDTNGNENRTGIFDVPVRLPPYFVWGDIFSHRGLPVGGAMVLITDLQTNETVIAYTDGTGRYQIDLGTLYSGYMDGENLTVFATDGSFYGRNESFIDVGTFDDATMTYSNRQVNVIMNEIPEFTAVLIPLFGMLVLVAFLGRRRRKKEHEVDI